MLNRLFNNEDENLEEDILEQQLQASELPPVDKQVDPVAQNLTSPNLMAEAPIDFHQDIAQKYQDLMDKNKQKLQDVNEMSKEASQARLWTSLAENLSKGLALRAAGKAGGRSGVYAAPQLDQINLKPYADFMENRAKLEKDNLKEETDAEQKALNFKYSVLSNKEKIDTQREQFEKNLSLQDRTERNNTAIRWAELNHKKQALQIQASAKELKNSANLPKVDEQFEIKLRENLAEEVKNLSKLEDAYSSLNKTKEVYDEFVEKYGNDFLGPNAKNFMISKFPDGAKLYASLKKGGRATDIQTFKNRVWSKTVETLKEKLGGQFTEVQGKLILDLSLDITEDPTRFEETMKHNLDIMKGKLNNIQENRKSIATGGLLMNRNLDQLQTTPSEVSNKNKQPEDLLSTNKTASKVPIKIMHNADKTKLKITYSDGTEEIKDAKSR